MRKFIILSYIIIFIIILIVSVIIVTGIVNISKSSERINSNVRASTLFTLKYSSIIYSDDFNGNNDTNALKSRGYLIYYRGSGPQGTSATWFQGNPSRFPAYNGPSNGYVASDFNVVTGQNNIDCWLVLPRISGGILIDDSLFFYSRSEQGNQYPDSIRVMFSSTDSIPEGVWSEIGRFKASSSGFWEKRGFKSANTNINGRYAIRYCIVNGGPTGQNSDYIGIDALSIIRGFPPVITHAPLGNCPRAFWPSTVLCQVSDNVNIDSVWVRWKINNGSYNRFKLVNNSGNNWSNLFNSNMFQVSAGDSIFYRIIAKNKSGYIDSTFQNKFCILAQPNCRIDTGSYNISYPFPLYFSNARTDILYKASDIYAGGGISGYITTIFFDVLDSNNTPIENFNLKMQQTTDSILTAFTFYGWTVCYSGTYTLQGTGWQAINLTTPFYWNGINNLLIEVCYFNSGSSHFTHVNATYHSFISTLYYYTNLLFIDGCNTPLVPQASTYRPNLCLSISSVLRETGNNTTTIPNNYLLFQNYPNPFNPLTKIKYAIPKQGFVKLNIYDILGREFLKLVNENKTPGSYIVEFNGSNLASGVYFCILTVEETAQPSKLFSSVKRMLLIK